MPPVNGTTKFVEKYSAGCQVFANIDDFNLFMQLAQRHKTLYGNDFTYTLIDERALVREAKKKLVFDLVGLGIAAAFGLITYQIVKET